MTSTAVLNKTEKMWIAFQLVCAVEQIHSKGLYHGDIKTNNVVVTSWNWIFLTDLAPFKPIYLSLEKLGEYQYFFSGETSGMNACYVAPEKFVATKIDSSSGSIETKQAMDIFSLGCVLAEIFLDNLKLFDQPKLLSYKNGTHDPRDALKDLKPIALRDCIIEMISVDPAKRKPIKEYVQIMINEIIPSAFSSFYYYFMAIMLHPKLSSPDRKTAMILTHLDAIWKCSFQKPVPYIVQSINDCVFEGVRDLSLEYIVPYIIPTNLPYCMQYSGYVNFLNEEKIPIPESESMKYS